MRQLIENHRVAIIALVLLILTFAAYWRVLGCKFIVYYDDGDYVTENPHVQAGLTAETVRWAFTTTRASNWHPLTWISHAADCGLYGLNPKGHHFTNLLLHAANTFLLFLVLFLMTGYFWRSAFVAALFAVHPLHVESVAWIAERKDVLSTFFWILTMLAYWNYARRPTVGRYVPVLAAFTLGLLSKPMLVTLPLVLLLLDYWPLSRKRPWSSLVLEKAPLLLLSATSCVITFLAQSRGGAADVLYVPTGARIANALVGYVTYLRKMLWPSDLAVLYPHHDETLVMWKATVSAILLIAISGLVFLLRRKRPYLTVGWLWFLGTLVPVIGLVQVGMQSIADRYTYVPLIGLFIIAAWLFSDFFQARKQAILPPTMGAAIVVLFAIMTWVQVGHWQDSTTLFEHALEVTSPNYTMEDLLGLALLKEGKLDEAAEHFRAALEIAPDYPPAHNNLAIVLAKQGKVEESLLESREALRLGQEGAEASLGTADLHYNMGCAFEQQGRYDEAMEEYREAIRLRPDFHQAHNNLAVGYFFAGDYAQAWKEVRLCQEYGGSPHQQFIERLSEKMPEPSR